MSTVQFYWGVTLRQNALYMHYVEDQAGDECVEDFDMRVYGVMSQKDMCHEH